MRSVVAMTIGSRAKIACGVIQSTFHLPRDTGQSIYEMRRAIEDNVRATCGDLIEECIVVGTGRPSPTLFVEPGHNVDHGKLKRDIIRKTRQFHARRYLHEQITNPDLIIVVPSKSLPRTATKGNIRRKAVEDAYQVELDRLYA